jgi:hypothetical protein
MEASLGITQSVLSSPSMFLYDYVIIIYMHIIINALSNIFTFFLVRTTLHFSTMEGVVRRSQEGFRF